MLSVQAQEVSVQETTKTQHTRLGGKTDKIVCESRIWVPVATVPLCADLRLTGCGTLAPSRLVASCGGTKRTHHAYKRY